MSLLNNSIWVAVDAESGEVFCAFGDTLSKIQLGIQISGFCPELLGLIGLPQTFVHDGKRPDRVEPCELIDARRANAPYVSHASRAP
jgi:hypothetical protein